MASIEELIEPRSLGISVKRKNDVDSKEVADLIDILKSMLYTEYKATSNDGRNEGNH
jgi:hypothetical protein